MDALQSILTISLLAAMVRLGTPVVLTALGETFAERSGILNLGAEGMMLVGAFAGFWGAYTSGSMWVGVALAVLAGLGMALVMAFLSVTLRADQVVAGIALLILGTGLTQFFNRLAFGVMPLVPRIDNIPPVEIPLLSSLPVIGQPLFHQNIFVYLTFLLTILSGIILYYTRWGLRIHAVGEHPRAADSAGIPVARIRYACVLIGGALAGLGGACLTLGELGLFVNNVTGGRGFIAVALVVFGRWNPYKVFAGGLLFGLIDALQIRLQSIGSPLPPQFMVMMPYVLTVLALLLVGRKAVGPASLAVPFKRGER